MEHPFTRFVLRFRWRLLLCAWLLALYPLNQGFYTGASIGHLVWRFEHGRLTLRYGEHLGDVSFYVAINSEPLRFALEGRWYGSGSWTVSLPIWLAIALVGASIAVSAGRRG